MIEELIDTVCSKPALYKKKPYLESPYKAEKQIIDIAAISAIGIYFNMQVLENEAFTTSLYKINSRI